MALLFDLLRQLKRLKRRFQTKKRLLSRLWAQHPAAPCGPALRAEEKTRAEARTLLCLRILRRKRTSQNAG